MFGAWVVALRDVKVVVVVPAGIEARTKGLTDRLRIAARQTVRDTCMVRGLWEVRWAWWREENKDCGDRSGFEIPHFPGYPWLYVEKSSS